MYRTLITIVVVAFLPSIALAQEDAQDIRLVVQVTVDGLRADLLQRYQDSFSHGGFHRFMERGVWYTNAHHMHANTETIVGHATLATGAHPSEHGMIGNAWLDRVTGHLGYGIEDSEHPLLPVPGFGGKGQQIDPSQAIAQAGGRSPRNLLATTFGDELFKTNNGRSKILGISGKDRSAVAMAGHFGDAFWFSTSTGAFETSEYYFNSYPDWVTEWNSQRPADVAIGTLWELSTPKESYLLAENDDRPYEVDLKGFGRVFPHRYGTPEDGLYYTQVLLTPLGDELTARFAETAVHAEGLGQDAFTDYLSVSFSAVDAVNHLFGPSSLENEEIMRRLDQTLEQFFAFLDQEIGAEHILYVLSADHGMPEMPEFMAEMGLSTARNYNGALKDALNANLAAEFGIQDAILQFFRPYIYLDRQAIAAAGLDKRAIERSIVDDLESRDGIAIAMPRNPFPEQIGDFLEGPIRRNFHPQRSGDIYVAQAPYSFLFEAGAVAVMHGSPWRYDTHVPIMFSGPGIEPQVVSRQVSTVDVAITLSNLLGTTIPSSAAGQILDEVVR
ncbi:Alkaline phosphatase PhoV precursor [Roseovarius albus]|uniref:Alkaline phosphatase PhoV n=1 Tax=Roseovarius albus TaxID=1247867 RepID=A0A1X6ZT44_9RHOB|nr:alkaline phosphatase family protein [Roseovarius albus]SLN60646.1 Alkaline phosphatase PhoV precursor [Roseovarius albus]